MNDLRALPHSTADFDAEFRESRIVSLTTLNLQTFWVTAIIVLSFSAWDYYADTHNWTRALVVRAAGSVIVAVTGFLQNLPGRSRWILPLAKVRLVVAATSAMIAASLLDRGYGFGVAGVAVIVLTGPYVTIDTRDLVRINLLAIIATFVVMFALPLDPFDRVGTAVFVLLAAVVSMLLGRVLENSNRRAFALELEQHKDARTDALTGLANRRAMQERGRIELKLARRSGAPVSVILADLDHFKSINDKYGHEAGDAALVATARVLRGALRESDALGRWGGEEFIAVLPATNAKGAAEVAERMRIAIGSTRFDGLSEGATISLGVTTSESVNDAAMEWDLLVKEADQRLYRAKHEGRNRVVSA